MAQNVISEGAGGEMISQYKSIIYYHEDRPRWFETIKVLHRIIFLFTCIYLCAFYRGRAGIVIILKCALVLCYSAAEYCTAVWSRSAHTSRVDVQLNCTMRLTSGTLRSTPLPWLPVLSNIEPPALQRKAATDKLVEKIVKHDMQLANAA